MKSIVCQFNIPRALVTNNRKQFNNQVLKDFCS